MFATAILFVAASAALVASHPLPRADDIDSIVLNFALTLEHLENAFYRGALEKFDDHAFLAAGMPEWARGRFEQIGQHEKAHVEFLSGALGSAAVKPCEYSFPYTDPQSFAALSQILEGVGVSAYAGAAQLITNKDYLTAAAVVLSTEARHASWIGAAVNKGAGWSGPLDTPLDINQVYTLAASFITSCPDSNAKLPVTAYAPLALSPATAKPGQKATLSSPDASVKVNGQTAVFFIGLSQISAPISDNGEVLVPEGIEGTVYVTVIGNDKKEVRAGPAILDLSVSSNGKYLH